MKRIGDAVVLEDHAAEDGRDRRLDERPHVDVALGAEDREHLADEPLELTTAQAYELQARIAQLREARGEKRIGYKVGCTSQAIQAQLGVNEPIFGRLFDTTCHPPGVRLSSACYSNLAVEGELSGDFSSLLTAMSRGCALVFSMLFISNSIRLTFEMMPPGGISQPRLPGPSGTKKEAAIDGSTRATVNRRVRTKRHRQARRLAAPSASGRIR